MRKLTKTEYFSLYWVWADQFFTSVYPNDAGLSYSVYQNGGKYVTNYNGTHTPVISEKMIKMGKDYGFISAGEKIEGFPNV